jgi:glucose uptake protein GlcU
MEIPFIPDITTFIFFVHIPVADYQNLYQTKQMNKKFLVSVIAAFILLSAAFYGLKVYAPAYRYTTLMVGNIIMAALCVGSYLLVIRQLNSRPAAFVRGVYSSSFLKLMVCMIGILAYVLINRPNIHKPTVFVLFGIYAVYSAIETVLLSKQAREAK